MPQKPGIDLNDTSNRIIAGIVLALIFIGGWWLIARGVAKVSFVDKGAENTDQGTESAEKESVVNSIAILGPLAENTPTIAGSRESVDIDDQPVGMSVKVKAATLAQAGWIAVRDADGRTLGAGRFEAGLHANVDVPLLRTTSAGERYQVLIYVDDGDKAFDLHKDILVMRGDGSVAGAVFMAQ